MAKKKSSGGVSAAVVLFDKLIATIPEIERKGDTNPYTAYNGNMFTHLADGELSIRLPEEEIGPFLKKYKSRLQEVYGVVRKEYVVVPDSLLKKTSELKKYLEISYAHVKTLKAKPTTKPKK